MLNSKIKNGFCIQCVSVPLTVVFGHQSYYACYIVYSDNYAISSGSQINPLPLDFFTRSIGVNVVYRKPVVAIF